MKLKILVHNIYFGFHSEPGILERKRLTHTKKIVTKQKPDVLIFIEAGYGAPNTTGKVFDYKKHFGFKHMAYVPQKTRLGIAILSNIPLHDAVEFVGDNGCALRVLLDVEPVPIDLIAIHPWFDAKDEEKIKFLLPVLELAAPPTIIAGDFNALSHLDTYEEQTLLASFKRFAGPEYKHLVKRLLERKLLPWLEEQGFVDVLASQDKTFTIPTDWADEEKMSPLRMDYILVTPDINVEKAKVIRGKDAESASDHYPITATLTF